MKNKPRTKPKKRKSTRGLSGAGLTILWSLIFAFVTIGGGLFVAMAVLLGKYELVSLVFILLVGSLLRSISNYSVTEKLDQLPVVGEASDVYQELEQYYRRFEPKRLLYYIFYPITGTLSFYFAEKKQRKELDAYFSLIKWIFLLIVIEGFASYYQIYQNFDWRFSLFWFYMELLCVYFLCNFFAVPVTTLTMKLERGQAKKSLFAVSLLGILILGYFFHSFYQDENFQNTIFDHVVLDHRVRESLDDQKSPEEFLPRLEDATRMFFRHYGEKIIFFNRRNAENFDEKARAEFFHKLNRDYQEILATFSFGNEYKSFYLTTTQEDRTIWAMVCLPLRESIFYFIRYRDGRMKIYSKWQQLSPQDQQDLQTRWDTSQFQYSQEKQFVRIMIDWVRKQMQKLMSATTPQPDKKNMGINFVDPARFFVIYSQPLKEFDYQKALKAKLVKDHAGTSPEVDPTIWNKLYGWLFSLLMILCAICMPLHIGVIFYCRFYRISGRVFR